MLEIAVVWAPRPTDPKWRGDAYMPLFDLQRQSCELFGHRQVVVTDGPALAGYDCLHAPMPQNLMKAILTGQIAYLEQWSGKHPVVLLDADCIVCRDLEQAFTGDWDILLTNRENDVSPIQNGAMYFAAGSRDAALTLFRQALSTCGEHWGGDQEAISQAVAPVPMRRHAIEQRFGVRVSFASTNPYNFSPAMRGLPKMSRDYFIVHFKGETKDMAAEFARLKFGLRAAS